MTTLSEIMLDVLRNPEKARSKTGQETAWDTSLDTW